MTPESLCLCAGCGTRQLALVCHALTWFLPRERQHCHSCPAALLLWAHAQLALIHSAHLNFPAGQQALLQHLRQGLHHASTGCMRILADCRFSPAAQLAQQGGSFAVGAQPCGGCSLEGCRTPRSAATSAGCRRRCTACSPRCGAAACQGGWHPRPSHRCLCLPRLETPPCLPADAHTQTLRLRSWKPHVPRDAIECPVSNQGCRNRGLMLALASSSSSLTSLHARCCTSGRAQRSLPAAGGAGQRVMADVGSALGRSSPLG